MSKIDCVALGGHLLRVEFSNGSIRDVDIEPLLSYPVFKRLDDDVQFRRFSIDHGVVTWYDGEIDIAPEWLFDHGMPQKDSSVQIEEPFVTGGEVTYRPT